jgi:hypothetical protein
MMTAVGQKADFSGAKRSGNTPAVLPQRATPKISLVSTALWGCGGNWPKAALALRLQPAAGMLAQKPPCLRPIPSATVSLRLNQRFLNMIFQCRVK